MKRAGWLLGVAVLLVLGSLLYNYVVPAQVPMELRLTEAQGEVSLERPEDGMVDPEVGTALQASDRIFTGNLGRATLSLGEETHIQVRPASSVEVVDVGEEGVSLELQGGALRATVRPDSGAVRIGNRGREVLAVHGELEVGVRDDVMQVRALDGTLSLRGTDVASLEAGEQVLVVEQHASVAPIPEELLLEVEWPATAQRTKEETMVLRGTTEPGVEVVIEGPFGSRTATAGADGGFAVEVPLAEGPNAASIRAVNALGDTVEVSGALPTRDTRAAVIRSRVEQEAP